MIDDEVIPDPHAALAIVLEINIEACSRAWAGISAYETPVKKPANSRAMDMPHSFFTVAKRRRLKNQALLASQIFHA